MRYSESRILTPRVTTFLRRNSVTTVRRFILSHPVQLVLEFQELPVFWLPHEREPEGGCLNHQIVDPGEVQEGPFGVSKKCVLPLVLLPLP